MTQIKVAIQLRNWKQAGGANGASCGLPNFSESGLQRTLSEPMLRLAIVFCRTDPPRVNV